MFLDYRCCSIIWSLRDLITHKVWRCLMVWKEVVKQLYLLLLIGSRFCLYKLVLLQIWVLNSFMISISMIDIGRFSLLLQRLLFHFWIYIYTYSICIYFPFKHLVVSMRKSSINSTFICISFNLAVAVKLFFMAPNISQWN